jgi:hypothetical protein
VQVGLPALGLALAFYALSGISFAGSKHPAAADTANRTTAANPSSTATTSDTGDDSSPVQHETVPEPTLWKTLKNTVQLTRQYLEDPIKYAGNRDVIQQLNLIVVNDPVGSRKLIPYMVNTAFTSDEDQDFFRDMRKIRDILQEDNKGKFAAFRNRVGGVGFDRLMGTIGQNQKEDPFRFDYFMQQAGHASQVSNAWRKAFVAHTAAEQALQTKYEGYRKTGRWLGYAGAAGTMAVTYLGTLIFGHFIWDGLPPDLQLAAAGVMADFAHERIKDWVRDRIDRKFSGWAPGEYRAVQKTYQELLKIDPKRTIPFLLNTAKGRSEEQHRMRPMEELASDLLRHTQGPIADQALVDLGVHYLQTGDGKEAREVFEELAHRNPEGLGKSWAQVREALDEAIDFGSVLTRLSRRGLFWKTLVGVPVGASAIYGALHYLEREQLSIAVTALRDVFLLSAGVYGLRRLSHILDERPTKLAASEGEEKLYQAFRRLSGLGEHGIEILSALAENKLPGELGTIVAQASKRVLAEHDDLAAAHRINRLAMNRGGQHNPEETGRMVNRSLERQGEHRDALCGMDFSALGKH